MSLSLKEQYERYPYPPIPSLALPKRGQGTPLKYENAGPFLNRTLSSKRIRILVIGGGTLEPLVVARAHPQASQAVSIDLSNRSVDLLKHRSWLFQLAHPFSRLAPLKALVGDFANLRGEDQSFDYVIASNVLHHTIDPALSLAIASRFLKKGGILRMVTYPFASRAWMRATSQWLKSHGIDKSAQLKKSALQSVRKLPVTHPIRACYESHPERGKEAGIIDAFFNARENPLTPLEWQSAAMNAGLQLLGESQDPRSQSKIVSEFLGTQRESKLDIWQKLEILDATWELCSNPILWFEKVAEPQAEHRPLKRPLSILRQMNEGFREADGLLRLADSNLQEWQSWLSREVGPRVWPKQPDEILHGLSMTEYSIEELLGLKEVRSGLDKLAEFLSML